MSSSATPNAAGCTCDPSAAAGALLLRLTVGVLFFFAGLNKLLAGIDMQPVLLEQFKATWLPAWMLTPYAIMLPYAELLLGAAVLLGLARVWSVGLAGALMLSLFFGKLLLGDGPGAATNAVYVTMFAAALLTARWDVLSLDRLLCRRRH